MMYMQDDIAKVFFIIFRNRINRMVAVNVIYLVGFKNNLNKLLIITDQSL